MIFGGSFNPPGLHHYLLAQGLTEYFDRVFVVPCGSRPDKEGICWVAPEQRATMCQITFGKIPKVTLDLTDIGPGEYTRTWELVERYQKKFPDDEIWLAVGTDLIAGGKDGQAEIQRTWARGKEIWQSLKYAVIARAGYQFHPADLPPHYRALNLDFPGSSTEIRNKLTRGKSVEGLVPEEVNLYITENGLYKG